MSKPYKNLAELLESAAYTNPTQSFTFTTYDNHSSESITFVELLIKAREIAAIIQNKVQRGDRVILLFAPGINFITAFYGCIISGAIAVPLPPPVNVESAIRFENVVKNSQPKLILSEKKVTSKLYAIAKIGRLRKLPFFISIYNYFSKISWSQTTFIHHKIQMFGLPWVELDALKKKEKNLKLNEIDSEPFEHCYIQYTSGSTRQPQGVIMNHANVISNLEGIKTRLNVTSSDVAVSWLPYYHDMGLIGYLFGPIMYRASCYLMSPFDFLRNPYNWLHNISEHGGTVTSAPNFAYDLCVSKITEEQKSNLDLSTLHIAMSGGEPIQADTLQRFTEKFKECGFNYDAFVPAYGLAESTVAVSMKGRKEPVIYLNLDKDDLRQNTVSVLPMDAVEGKLLYSCGKLLPDQEVVIVNTENNTVVKSDNIGEIWLKGPYVAQGYWEDSVDANQIFTSFLQDGSGPYLRTGDLGFIHKEHLYITGRFKDLIIIRGHNYYPHDIEQTIEQCYSGIKQGYTVAFSINSAFEEKLVIVSEIVSSKIFNNEECIDAIKNAVSKSHGLAPYEIVLIPAKTLQKTTSGKIQRQKTKQLFLNKSLPIIGHWRTKDEAHSIVTAVHHPSYAPNDVHKWLLSWIKAKKNLSEDEINKIKDVAHLGMDSLHLTEFVVDLKNKFNISIDPLDLLNCGSIEQLAHHLVSLRRN
ncbi:AMP-binding protein [Legionella fallonii]|uniref:Putative Long-chain-fatty-acid--AMP ligase FadD29 n=1 Tax=Legionella fallonii LLAP-10 TaxID=1212491 RepID=A0A098G613_9GAMM|nr:AMP-binding protein [Legionella fallonii]CEG57892.1 putative Long-chain-fatty-acid--AMP ligase FadD29 [Legionella fallonii LLAP-10]